MSDPALVQVLDESQARIATMSYIHESLYRNKDFSSISFSRVSQQAEQKPNQQLCHSRQSGGAQPST